MGANFHYDEMLPAVKPETNEPNAKRQLEVFTYAGKLHIRIGQVNHENSGVERYTVVVPREQVKDIIFALENG